MKIFKLIFISLSVISFTACGQTASKNSETNPQSKTIQKDNKMDTSKLTNETVKKAFDALQTGDKVWYTFFIENPTMTDDGNKVDFKNFFAKALGTEKFLTIDRVENDGKDIYGNFKAGQWGTFPVFFKFHQNAEGKFDRLDIGQGK